MSAAPTGDDGPSTGRPATSGARWVGVALTVLAAAPLLVAVVARWGGDHLPMGDIAVLELRTRDVLGGDVPLVGVYSQFGWNHPGPLLFWVLAPVHALLGGSGWSLQVAGVLVQLGAVVATSVLAWRWGGLRLQVLVLVVVALSYGATGWWIALEAWNPHIAYPFLPLLALLVWRAGVGPGWALAGAVGVGSFLVQAHVGYATLVAGAGAWLVGWVLATAPSRHPAVLWRRWRASLLGAGAVALLAWSGPFLDAAREDRTGNLGSLWRYFVQGEAAQPRAGARQGLGLLAHEVEVPPPWLGGGDDLVPLTGTAAGAALGWLALLVVVAAVGAWAWPRASDDRRRLLSLAWVLLVAGVVALVQLRGPAYPYLVLWRVPVVVLLVAATADAALDRWRGVLGADPARQVALGAGAAALIALGAVPLAVDVARAPDDSKAYEAAAGTLLDQVGTDAVGGPVLVRYAGPNIGGVQGSIIDALDADGVEVRVDPQVGFQFGEHRAAATDEVAEVWYVAEQGTVRDVLAAWPGARVVASTTPLSPAEEAELTDLQQEIGGLLRAQGRDDVAEKLDSPLVVFDLGEVPEVSVEDRDRLGELTQRVADAGTCRCGIVAFSPAEAPPPAAVGGDWQRP